MFFGLAYFGLWDSLTLIDRTPQVEHQTLCICVAFQNCVAEYTAGGRWSPWQCCWLFLCLFDFRQNCQVCGVLYGGVPCTAQLLSFPWFAGSVLLLFQVVLIIFVNKPTRGTLFFLYVYFYSLHVSGNHAPIISIINCINATPGICHSV